MPYKKKRIIKSPNKNQERSQRGQSSSLSLQNYFPEVERLIVDLRFMSKHGHLLQDEHREYGPNDPVNFLETCPGGCWEGKTNLQGKIESIVRQRHSDGRGQARCAEQLYGSSDPCGCEIDCKVSVVYHPG